MKRGMALPTTLLMSSILLILGLSFLYFLERDYRFAGRQENQMEAYYLARAGLTYQKTFPAQTSVKKYLSFNGYFEVTVSPDGRVESRGVVASPLGLAIAERTLVVNPRQPVRQFAESSL